MFLLPLMKNFVKNQQGEPRVEHLKPSSIPVDIDGKVIDLAITYTDHVYTRDLEKSGIFVDTIDSVKHQAGILAGSNLGATTVLDADTYQASQADNLYRESTTSTAETLEQSALAQQQARLATAGYSAAHAACTGIGNTALASGASLVSHADITKHLLAQAHLSFNLVHQLKQELNHSCQQLWQAQVELDQVNVSLVTNGLLSGELLAQVSAQAENLAQQLHDLTQYNQNLTSSQSKNLATLRNLLQDQQALVASNVVVASNRVVATNPVASTNPAASPNLATVPLEHTSVTAVAVRQAGVGATEPTQPVVPQPAQPQPAPVPSAQTQPAPSQPETQPVVWSVAQPETQPLVQSATESQLLTSLSTDFLAKTAQLLELTNEKLLQKVYGPIGGVPLTASPEQLRAAIDAAEQQKLDLAWKIDQLPSQDQNAAHGGALVSLRLELEKRINYLQYRLELAESGPTSDVLEQARRDLELKDKERILVQTEHDTIRKVPSVSLPLVKKSAQRLTAYIRESSRLKTRLTLLETGRVIPPEYEQGYVDNSFSAEAAEADLKLQASAGLPSTVADSGALVPTPTTLTTTNSANAQPQLVVAPKLTLIELPPAGEQTCISKVTHAQNHLHQATKEFNDVAKKGTEDPRYRLRFSRKRKLELELEYWQRRYKLLKRQPTSDVYELLERSAEDARYEYRLFQVGHEYLIKLDSTTQEEKDASRIQMKQLEHQNLVYNYCFKRAELFNLIGLPGEAEFNVKVAEYYILLKELERDYDRGLTEPSTSIPGTKVYKRTPSAPGLAGDEQARTGSTDATLHGAQSQSLQNQNTSSQKVPTPTSTAFSHALDPDGLYLAQDHEYMEQGAHLDLITAGLSLETAISHTDVGMAISVAKKVKKAIRVLRRNPGLANYDQQLELLHAISDFRDFQHDVLVELKRVGEDHGRWPESRLVNAILKVRAQLKTCQQQHQELAQLQVNPAFTDLLSLKPEANAVQQAKPASAQPGTEVAGASTANKDTQASELATEATTATRAQEISATAEVAKELGGKESVAAASVVEGAGVEESEAVKAEAELAEPALAEDNGQSLPAKLPERTYKLQLLRGADVNRNHAYFEYLIDVCRRLDLVDTALENYTIDGYPIPDQVYVVYKSFHLAVSKYFSTAISIPHQARIIRNKLDNYLQLLTKDLDKNKKRKLDNLAKDRVEYEHYIDLGDFFDAITYEDMVRMLHVVKLYFDSELLTNQDATKYQLDLETYEDAEKYVEVILCFLFFGPHEIYTSYFYNGDLYDPEGLSLPDHTDLINAGTEAKIKLLDLERALYLGSYSDSGVEDEQDEDELEDDADLDDVDDWDEEPDSDEEDNDEEDPEESQDQELFDKKLDEDKEELEEELDQGENEDLDDEELEEGNDEFDGEDDEDLDDEDFDDEEFGVEESDEEGSDEEGSDEEGADEEDFDEEEFHLDPQLEAEIIALDEDIRQNSHKFTHLVEVTDALKAEFCLEEGSDYRNMLNSLLLLGLYPTYVEKTRYEKMELTAEQKDLLKRNIESIDELVRSPLQCSIKDSIEGNFVEAFEVLQKLLEYYQTLYGLAVADNVSYQLSMHYLDKELQDNLSKLTVEHLYKLPVVRIYAVFYFHELMCSNFFSHARGPLAKLVLGATEVFNYIMHPTTRNIRFLIYLVNMINDVVTIQLAMQEQDFNLVRIAMKKFDEDFAKLDSNQKKSVQAIFNEVKSKPAKLPFEVLAPWQLEKKFKDLPATLRKKFFLPAQELAKTQETPESEAGEDVVEVVLKFQPQAQAEAKAEVGTETAVEKKTEVVAESQDQAEVEVKAQAEKKAEVVAESQDQAEVEVKAQAEKKAEVVSESQPQPSAEEKSQLHRTSLSSKFDIEYENVNGQAVIKQEVCTDQVQSFQPPAQKQVTDKMLAQIRRDAQIARKLISSLKAKKDSPVSSEDKAGNSKSSLQDDQERSSLVANCARGNFAVLEPEEKRTFCPLRWLSSFSVPHLIQTAINDDLTVYQVATKGDEKFRGFFKLTVHSGLEFAVWFCIIGTYSKPELQVITAHYRTPRKESGAKPTTFKKLLKRLV